MPASSSIFAVGQTEQQELGLEERPEGEYPGEIEEELDEGRGRARARHSRRRLTKAQKRARRERRERGEFVTYLDEIHGDTGDGSDQ